MMIQDLNNHFYNPTYYNIKPMDDDFILCYKNGYVLLIDGKIPLYRNCKRKCIFGFTIDENKYFISLETIDKALEYKNINIFRYYEPHYQAFAIITGYHLWRWYQKNKYCGNCGKKLIYGDKERKVFCPNCGNEEFPKICPAVIVGLLHNGRILLTKYRVGYSQYALVAGYTEIGETLEQTVCREVYEEVGLHVRNLRYYKSQPWGASGSILAGFFADVIDDNDEPVLQLDELKEAKWFTKDEIDLPSDNISLTREMILLFKNGDV